MLLFIVEAKKGCKKKSLNILSWAADLLKLVSVGEHTSLNFYGLQSNKVRCTHEVALVCINIRTIVWCV